MQLILCDIYRNVGTYLWCVHIKILSLSYKLDVGHTWVNPYVIDSYVDT